VKLIRTVLLYGLALAGASVLQWMEFLSRSHASTGAYLRFHDGLMALGIWVGAGSSAAPASHRFRGEHPGAGEPGDTSASWRCGSWRPASRNEISSALNVSPNTVNCVAAAETEASRRLDHPPRAGTGMIR
jgi:hypothetical protein